MKNKAMFTLLEVLLLCLSVILIILIEFNYSQKDDKLQKIIQSCYYQSQSREQLDWCINSERAKQGLEYYERISQ